MNSLYAKGGGTVQIAEQIAARIKDGALRPGELLPPVRQLAAELEVNPNTVASAYARLRDAGLVATRGRAGTVVLEPPLVGDYNALNVAGAVAVALDGRQVTIPTIITAGRNVIAAANTDGTLARLQASGVQVASQLLSMLPYLATIVVLAIMSRNPTWIRVNMPASLGKPFYPGS